MHHVSRRISLVKVPLCNISSPIRISRLTMATQGGGRSYNDAIDALNSLQTPYAIVEARRKAGIRPDAASIAEMRVYIRRIGLALSDLDRLNIVHVAGTKGKGSTCAFAASILQHYQRAHGIPRKIGLFTSPHLIAVRERIRINGVPITEEVFAKYFFERTKAERPKGGACPMATRPIYSRYLTLMSYHVYLKEGIDVAVYETGIGGEYDATNVVQQPVATGISTLGIDHVFALGDTIEKIAWHKAGIMKAGSAAFTIGQVSEAAKVLQHRAQQKKVNLKALGVDPRLHTVNVRPDALFQKKNASLGIALAETVLQKLDPNFSVDPEKLSRVFTDGLEQVVWRGRCEVKVEGPVVWHIDGAHTVDSLRMATKWFAGECASRLGPKALVFNQQGRTEAVDFLEGMISALKSQGQGSFDHVVFCTNVTYASTGYKRDFVNHQHDPQAIEKLTAQHQFAEKWSSLDPDAKVVVLPTIEDAISHVRDLGKELDGERTVQAFITGSLHLVGGALGILEKA
ncbi:tetrahydrofolylpolyglutamate synthase, partial [Xylariales sp. AK1849]